MKVQLSIPNEGVIRSELAIKLPRWLQETSHTVFFESSVAKPIEHNRNLIVQRFLQSDRDYLLQIDSDVVPAQNPLKLVDLSLDIVSAPCWIFQHKPILNVYRFDQDGYLKPLEENNSGLVQIDATGTGIVLLSRNVLQSIKAPFARKYDENGLELLGQDLFFSEKAREQGFKLYTHFDYIAKHYKTIDISIINNLTNGSSIKFCKSNSKPRI